jgi:hypothetical protein
MNAIVVYSYEDPLTGRLRTASHSTREEATEFNPGGFTKFIKVWAVFAVVFGQGL